MTQGEGVRLSFPICAVVAATISICLPYGGLHAEAAWAATDTPATGSQTVHSSTGNAKIATLSEELEIIHHHAEDIYDLAKANKWKSVERTVGALKKAGQTLGTLPNEESAMLLPRLSRTITGLEESIAARKRIDAMRLANKITLIEAAMAEPLKPRVPTNVGLLDFYGRELDMWSEARDMERLSYIVVRMHLAWQTLIPQFSTQNDLRFIKRFAEILKRLDLATTPEEYGRLAAQVRDEVDDLEKAFRNEALRGKERKTAK